MIETILLIEKLQKLAGRVSLEEKKEECNCSNDCCSTKRLMEAHVNAAGELEDMNWGHVVIGRWIEEDGTPEWDILTPEPLDYDEALEALHKIQSSEQVKSWKLKHNEEIISWKLYQEMLKKES
jgi:hypothetical protein